MTLAYEPRVHRDGQLCELLLVVVLTPLVALGTIAAFQLGIGTGTTVLGLIAASAALVASALLYAAWRVSPDAATGWVAAATIVLGMQGMTLFALGLLGHAQGPRFGLLVSDLVFILSVAACLVRARNRPIPIDPAVLGVILGGLLSTGRVAAVVTLDHAHPPHRLTTLFLVLFGALAVAVCAPALRVTVRGWSGGRLAAVVGSVTAGHGLLLLADGAAWGQVGAVVGDTTSSVLLAMTAVTVFGSAIEEEHASLDHLHDELARVAAGTRANSAVMHEVTATIAGISSAVRLLNSSVGLNRQRRRLLEEMVDQELSRLSRLVDRRGDPVIGPPGTVDLDHTIATLALAQEARGHQVTWQPSGATATAEADSVTEILNILLDNAAKHGAASTTVEVRQCGTNLEIAVADDGPGIPREVRPRLFEWGARGPRSGGQGIGLTIAHDLALREGGYLRLIEAPGRGATFVLGLHGAGNCHEQRAELA